MKLKKYRNAIYRNGYNSGKTPDIERPIIGPDNAIYSRDMATIDEEEANTLLGDVDQESQDDPESAEGTTSASETENNPPVERANESTTDEWSNPVTTFWYG